MIFKSDVKFLSSEQKQSAKGNKYTISSFIQEGSADVLMCMDSSGLKLEFGQVITAIFDYNPKYQKIEFKGIN